ncbi:hypothetical protein [Lentzea jiangxiensis]|uniref:hypothetical protein n=1 Tax=Lentzea jiangxiensis TaxID=641025 RepID=UPI000B7F12EA|nr:hypothetical protein [Lentzea jiangxiensis]
MRPPAVCGISCDARGTGDRDRASSCTRVRQPSQRCRIGRTRPPPTPMMTTPYVMLPSSFGTNVATTVHA